MANYPKGITVFSPRQGAPDFVKGTIIISVDEFVQFCDANQKLLTDYKGTKQLRLQLKEGNKGLYAEVDTYQPKPKAEQPQNLNSNDSSDLPF